MCGYLVIIDPIGSWRPLGYMSASRTPNKYKNNVGSSASLFFGGWQGVKRVRDRSAVEWPSRACCNSLSIAH